MLSDTTIIGGISAFVSSYPIKLFLKFMDNFQKKKAMIIISAIWLCFLLGLVFDWLYSITLFYILSLVLTIFLIAFCYFVIVFKNNKIEKID